MPPTRNYHIVGGRVGLGDATQPPTPAYETCQPWDGACVQRNTDKGNAYALATAGYVAQRNYDQCQANAKLSIGMPNYASSLATCDAAFQQAKDEAAQTAATPVTWGPPSSVPTHTTPIYIGPATPAPPVNTPPVNTVTSSGAPATGATPPASGQAVIQSSGAPAVGNTPPASGQTVIQSSGANQAATSTGFDLSSIPWWGWAAAAGAAFFMVGGSGRGR